MHKVYFANFDLVTYEVYLETVNFRSVDVQSVSKLYLSYFDTCVHKRYFMMFRSNLDIYYVLFLSF